MASSSNELGYEHDRFTNQVSENFHCPICLNVLKDPVMCRWNQHHFCTGCITRHLHNSNTCPTCMDELSVETLSQAQRIYTTYLSELQIRCDYFNRGCPEFVDLGNLKTHVENCGFSPVVCSNEGCNMEINRRDIIYHETEVCELRKVKCHQCVEIRKEIDDMKASQTEMKASQTEMKAHLTDLKANQAEAKANQTETRANLSDMNDQLRLQMRCMQDEIVNKVEAMMAGIKPALAAESETKEAVQRPSQDPTTNTRSNILVAGGDRSNGRAINSVEMFCWSRKAWVPLKPMRTQRERLSSFVHKNQMIVAGGFTPQGFTNTMEAMNINPEPGQWLNYPIRLPAKLTGHKNVVHKDRLLVNQMIVAGGYIPQHPTNTMEATNIKEQGQWLDYPARLPGKLSGHKNVVHKDRLLVVGGFDADKRECSDAISEVRLVPPYPTKLLYRMPKPRIHHGVELHNDNIFIAGGSNFQDSIASIAKYDVVKNEYREVAKLPFAVNEVATVSWKSYMLVVGGINEKCEAVNTVVLYDIEKEECHTLPSMIHKRKGCTAVVSGDLIVVMGGRNREGFLNSVECFDFARYSWEELPAMLEARHWATACCC